ncbi:ArsR family transcriptional regulator, partial [Candidatus Bathyarchaeota archaeon]|nr:ArsR family transcriptional regulator [Candidatus Bathyarchaeota archaeon]
MDFWFTEVMAKIYAYLRKVETATAEGIAKGADIYITTVRQTIAEMYHEGWVNREKVKKSGVGKPAFIYTALAPNSLVKRLTDDMNNKLEKLLHFAHRIEDEKSNEN